MSVKEKTSNISLNDVILEHNYPQFASMTDRKIKLYKDLIHVSIPCQNDNNVYVNLLVN